MYTYNLHVIYKYNHSEMDVWKNEPELSAHITRLDNSQYTLKILQYNSYANNIFILALAVDFCTEASCSANQSAGLGHNCCISHQWLWCSSQFVLTCRSLGCKPYRCNFQNHPLWLTWFWDMPHSTGHRPIATKLWKMEYNVFWL